MDRPPSTRGTGTWRAGRTALALAAAACAAAGGGCARFTLERASVEATDIVVRGTMDRPTPRLIAAAIEPRAFSPGEDRRAR